MILLSCTGLEEDTAHHSFVPPLDGGDALASIEIMDGFRLELFAAEPLIQDPVAMEVDEYGRIYVVEMRSYPLDASGLGRVKLLEDASGDGYPDSYTIFADSLAFPNGIMRWKNGLLVTDAPYLYYLEDSTGDGKADIKEIILTGFARSNPQHNYNTPLYGLDNWIYLANGGTIRTETYEELFGDQGSEVRFYGVDGAPVLPVNGADRNVRFRPESHELELLSSRSQFGHTFDPWGNHFLISNAHHQFFEVIERRYMERNPHLPLRSAIWYTPEHGNAADVYPITLNPEHQLLTDRGVFTSASGITWYQGGAFPEPFNRVTFAAESVHNLVHADVIEEDGVSFKARRLLEGKEFMASKDAWFRPVQFYIGPEGALYVIDYYRRIIEHPQWMDDEVIDTSDLYESTTRGRIYRVVPEKTGPPEWVSLLRLGEEPGPQLADHLESPNIWWRRNAQRLLMDRREEADSQTVERLKQIARNSDSPAGRLHAFWTLEGLGVLQSEMILAALSDSESGVRQNAVRLAESRAGNDPGVMNALYELSGDNSARVRYHLALALGGFDRERAVEIRREMLFRDIEDEWMQIAYLSGNDIDAERIFEEVLETLAGSPSASRALFFTRLSAIISLGEDTGEIRRLLNEGLTVINDENAWWKSAILAGLADALPNTEIDLSRFRGESRLVLDTFFDTDVEEIRTSAIQLLNELGIPATEREEVMVRVLAIAENRDQEETFRADAIRLITMIDPERYEEELLRFSRPDEPSVVQQEAINGLGKIPGSRIAEYLLDNWGAMTPAVRDRAVDALMREEERIQMLLDAVEENRVLVSTIGWGRRVVLMRDMGDEIRDRARELLREDPQEREEVLERYRDALVMNGDPERGREVYLSTCSACHQVREQEGVAFGPDLATVRHWQPQALMSKVLNPNRSIADGYEMWIVERSSGPAVAGVIVDESSGSVTVSNAGGVETTIPRTDIESINATNVSAMPAGLENEINEQQMADLIAYIRSL
jgi:putative membrane-bound dehydrogenase-like protein